jgi:hypothetical protein
MTLKEKFNKISCSDCDMPYCDIKCTRLGEYELNHLEKIADEFAIGFAEWTWDRELITINDCDYFEYKFNLYTRKELLEIYKTEKEL